MKTLKIAFLDITHPHVWTRADILSQMSNIILTKVWEPRDPESCRLFADRYGVEVVKTAEAILEDPEIDAVIVESYTHYMRDIVEKAIANGKAVLVEKPAANDLANMRSLVDACKNASKLVQVGYMMRQSPMIDFARTVLSQKLLGRMTLARFHVALPAPDAITPWFNLENDLGGALFEDGCHMVDLIVHLLGRPHAVHGFTPKFSDLTKLHSHRYEDAAVVSLAWEELVGTLTVAGWEANEWIETWSLEFFGAEGTLRIGLLPECYELYLKADTTGFRKGWNRYQKTQFNISWLDERAQHVWHAVQNRGFFERELSIFVDAIRENKTRAGVSPEDALNVIEVIAAVYEAARSGNAGDLSNNIL